MSLLIGKKKQLSLKRYVGQLDKETAVSCFT